MLKRWDTWPRGVRWLVVGIAAVVVVAAVSWWLLVPATYWLARHDVGSVKGANLQTARDAARGRLLTLGAGLFAAGALLFTARNFILSREAQVTDRYTKAITQLGDKKLDVRIGGIYALERIARDSPRRDHPTVMEVLTAFIREHSREQWPKPDPDGTIHKRSTRPDVQAALTVIGRRDTKHDIRPIDLNDADLYRARLVGAHLGGAILTDADLVSADLTGARLTGADLTLARLPGADLTGADLTGANFNWTDLADARLVDANLTKADLTEANLTKANLTGADINDADFGGADLADADLRGANPTAADLTGARLTGAKWPADTPAPEGWKLDTGSGRLVKAHADSGPTEAN